VNAVFLDTVGLLATWDGSDQWHEPARQAYQQLLSQRRPVLTSRFILLECGNAAARRPYRSAVARFRQEMELSGRIIGLTDDDWTQAWDAYSRGNAASAGIVDHVSFVLMQRLGLHEAFTNDKHFKAAGFTALFECYGPCFTDRR
jgi:predicted nucleic acid-binding protein